MSENEIERGRCVPEAPFCEAHKAGRSWLLTCPSESRLAVIPRGSTFIKKADHG